MAWHGDARKRWTLGEQAEHDFDAAFDCWCGGSFVPNADKNPFQPDRRCNKCGLLVDVKCCKDALDYAAVCISQPAFDHYDGEVRIIAKFGDNWWGRAVSQLRLTLGPVFPPAHQGPNATPFYKLERRYFYPATNYARRRKAAREGHA